MKQILTYLCSLIIVAFIAVPTQADTVQVGVDIKPGSCPNSLNVNSGGVLPVAILGTVDFDVTTVDIPTVLLEGVVAPLRWDYTMGSEGMLDLTYKFDMHEVVEALGEVFDGEFRVLVLTGVLLDEYGGTPIEGGDEVRILQKGQ